MENIVPMNSGKQNPIIEKGMWHYVFFHGVLRFGLGFGLLSASTNAIFLRKELFLHIVISVLVVPWVIGIPWGISMWYFFTKSNLSIKRK